MSLRDLRLWHWRKVESLRATAVRHEADAGEWERKYPSHAPCRHSRNQARNYHRNANFHLGAVQALNDVVDGTAENDNKRKHP